MTPWYNFTIKPDCWVSYICYIGAHACNSFTWSCNKRALQWARCLLAGGRRCEACKEEMIVRAIQRLHSREPLHWQRWGERREAGNVSRQCKHRRHAAMVKQAAMVAELARLLERWHTFHAASPVQHSVQHSCASLGNLFGESAARRIECHRCSSGRGFPHRLFVQNVTWDAMMMGLNLWCWWCYRSGIKK